MGIPKKALRESQLTYLTAGSAVDGSHQTFRVTFNEESVCKHAFLKKLEPANHYPELLAKMSVATSVLKGVFQGNYSAEERLVFDDDGHVVGTLSIAIEGFKPFNFYQEAVPTDADLRDQVIPSTKTLIAKNIMEVLLGRWFLDDDDAHPHNLGFAGNHAADIDFDMFWYWFTIYMKEPRTVIGVPKKRIFLSVDDWEHFPNTKDAKHYHWPTYNNPGQETLPTAAPVGRFLPKAYADPGQFQRLANDAQAHEQKLAAALKILLTYQPEVIRARLFDAFGDMALNYTSLDATNVALRVTYETEFPLWCNRETNAQPFVDFIMKLYQEHYDNLYRIVVFYLGNDNNGYGVRLQATHNSLYYKPSLYQQVLKWANLENTTSYCKGDARVQYQPDELEKRYHQIWRDAFAPGLRELLQGSWSLTATLFRTLSNIDLCEITAGKESSDSTLTRSWQLFGTMPELVRANLEPSISVDKDSELREGLLLLIDFTNQLHAIIKAYYEKSYAELTVEDNRRFSESINALHSDYNVQIRKKLAYTSSYSTAFHRLSLNLRQFAEQVNFQVHLTTTDEQMLAVTVTAVPTVLLPHTHPDVMAQFNDSLFIWAKSLPASELNRLIVGIIDDYYSPYVASLSLRGRASPVKAYLEHSADDSGDNRLAYILSSGKESGELNALLIKHLTPLVLQVHPLPSIEKARQSGQFETDKGVFVRSAIFFAKNDSRFSHLYSKEGMSAFYSTLFDWVQALPSGQFIALVKSALTAYEQNLSGYSFGWYTSRRTEVEGYCREHGAAKALAMTFLNGATTSTLNDTLFHKVVSAIQSDVAAHPEQRRALGYRLITLYKPEEHKTMYLGDIQVHSRAPSHRQETPPVARAAASLYTPH